MYRVFDSPVDGKGIIATDFIPKDTLLFKVTGERIPYREFHKKYGNDTTYSIKVLNWYYICYKEEPFRSQNPIIYINHSDDPNVKYKHGGVYSIRDIYPDEEIFLKYPKNYPNLSNFL